MAIDSIRLPLSCGLEVNEWQTGSQHRSNDLLWKDYFRDPTQWWDNRNSKTGSAYPDFKHKARKDCLWVDGRRNPPWVVGELRKRDLAVSTQAQSTDPCECNGNIAELVASLRACAKSKDFYKGTRLHDTISKLGLLEKCSDALVTMYAKCGALAKAKALLDLYNSRDIFSWTAVIAGYVRKGQSRDALCCFEQMQQRGISPDSVTFLSILRACGSLKAPDKGKQIHDEIARQGLLEKDTPLGNALVDMYAKCGSLAKAQQVLEELPSRNISSWNSLIVSYVQQGQAKKALDCYKRLQREGLSPNEVTFSSILKACSSTGAVEVGEQIHNYIDRQGLLRNNVVLGTALVDMYAKCGVLTRAQEVLDDLPFQDIVAWNALIAGYTQQGQGVQALHCFEKLQQVGLSPNAITFTCILKACGIIGECDKGEHLHQVITQQGLLKDDRVLGNALVDMYARCGAWEKAQGVLEELHFQDVTLWNALITGYAQQGKEEQALHCFERMQDKGLTPDAVTYASILKACGAIGAAEKGHEIHDMVKEQGLLQNDMVLGTALVYMYAKCGALVKAQQVLQELPARNANSWTALITGYAQQGKGHDVLSCFKEMQLEGLSPDSVTFSCVLNACSHLGLIDDGIMHFANMRTKYGVEPSLEHYTCMVDLLGRAGHLDKAVNLIQEMSPSDDFAIWSALLGACWKWRDVNVGRWAFEQALQVDKTETAAYVIMANIYADAGMQEDAEIVKAMRQENHV
ncbi:hypothetical protein GOP47_0007828 [Adiantum capillus-veneris]|uniref:Pentatricopeptide repeat-containing protein n=1 Tax=Adiantum capillus-veneris TaxID=13818 RepID=A0A9D4V1T7_ADICA|nr:hypothetical protein GOP47_0007828 [Adiantum capillus-veneris]